MQYNANMLQRRSAQVIRTRIAPSPTGEDIHIGNLYTALMNYAFAAKNDGSFIIRIEDTDRERYQAGAEEKILFSIKAFGLSYKEGPDIGGPYAPYKQSERLPTYKKYAEELIQKGAAYYCFCTKDRLLSLREEQLKDGKKTRYDKHCLININNLKDRITSGESYVVRLNVAPNKKIHIKDLIRGEITIDSNEVDDQVLLKSDGFPTYHLGVVVDDHLMKISHVIRAEEWISSTPKHVLLHEALGWDQPIYAHVPILRNPDKSKLSKRRNPVWASWYLEQGFLPEAILNFLALLGWSHPEEKEIFSLSEFIKLFELEDVKPVGPIFDLTKLRWMNQQYIQMKSDIELKKLILNYYPKSKELPDATINQLMPLLKSRMEILTDFQKLTGVFFDKFADQVFSNEEKDIARNLIKDLSNLQDWNHDMIFETMKKSMNENKVRMPLFYRLFTGEERGLPLPETLQILGKEKTLERIEDIAG